MVRKNSFVITFVLGLTVLSLSACGARVTRSTTAPAPQPVERTVQTTPEATTRAPEPQLIEPTTSLPPEQAVQSLPAAIALRDQASIAANANDYSRAIGLLERALRISPDDPQTFYDLALNHLSLQQPQQALQLARRGLSLNPTNKQKDALDILVARGEAML